MRLPGFDEQRLKSSLAKALQARMWGEGGGAQGKGRGRRVAAYVRALHRMRCYTSPYDMFSGCNMFVNINEQIGYQVAIILWLVVMQFHML